MNNQNNQNYQNSPNYPGGQNYQNNQNSPSYPDGQNYQSNAAYAAASVGGTPQKSNKTAGLVILVAGLFLAAVSLLLGTIGVGNFKINAADMVGSFALAAYGLVLMFKRVKGYGWGIGAVLGFTAIISALVKARYTQIATGAILLVVFSALLILANTKKSN